MNIEQYVLPWSKDGCLVAELSSIPEEGQRPKIRKQSDIYFIDHCVFFPVEK